MFDPKTQNKVNAAKDYYYILGIRTDATTEEIKEAYEELHEKFGPHVSASGMDQDIMIKTFNDISDAYEILIDPVKRLAYDKNSSDSRQSQTALRALWSKRPGSVSSSSLDSSRMPKVTALAMEMEIDISLKEAAKGTKKVVRISDPRACESCHGVRTSGRSQCQHCRGLGYFNVERATEIDLPPGMYDNMEIRLAEQGRFDLRAKNYGDLIVRVKLQPHPVLGVLGRDITCTVPVTIYEAVLGAEIEVPSATGRIVMRIQPLTQSGRVYRLKGLGLAGADQLITIDVQIPKALSGEEVALYQKLKDLSKGANPREALFKQQT